MNKDLTCATFNWSGKMDVSIDLLIKDVIGPVAFDQLSSFFENHFHPFLSAFRSGHGCQTALLKIIEDWKKAMDDNKCVAAILMDISKAFDCLPHNGFQRKKRADRKLFAEIAGRTLTGR
jgi:hypothetical protein